MDRLNLVDLQKGTNEVIIRAEDLGVSSGSIPIARIPENSRVINTYLRVFERFEVEGSHQSGGPIPYNLSVGVSDDDEIFIENIPVNSVSQNLGLNSGSYFSSLTREQFTKQTQVYLGVHIIPRVWIVEPSISQKRQFHGTVGTIDTGLVTGGTIDLVVTVTNTTEEFNGTSWSSGGILITERFAFGAAGRSITQSLVFGGIDSSSNFLSSSETYNGTTWSSEGSLSTTLRLNSGCGTGETEALSIGGKTATSTYWDGVYEYNGTSWSTLGSLNISRFAASAAGDPTAAIVSGGEISSSSRSSYTEEYNGTSWSVGGNLGIGRAYHGGSGTASVGVVTGGYSPTSSYSIGDTEEYDGTSWNLGNLLNIPRNGICGSGFSAAGSIIAGGADGSVFSSVEGYYNSGIESRSGSASLVITLA